MFEGGRATASAIPTLHQLLIAAQNVFDAASGLINGSNILQCGIMVCCNDTAVSSIR